MSKEIKLVFDFPPTVNSYWTLVRRGKMCSKIVSKRGMECKDHVYEECVNQLGKWEPLEGDLCLLINAHPPDRRRRDIDNLFKSLLDAMEDAKLFKDDCQVHILKAKKHKFDVEKKGIVEITLLEV